MIFCLLSPYEKGSILNEEYVPLFFPFRKDPFLEGVHKQILTELPPLGSVTISLTMSKAKTCLC